MKLNVNVNCSIILLTIILCILKVAGIISISWWWCFGLIWIPFAVIFALFFILVILALIYAIIVFIPYLHKELKK